MPDPTRKLPPHEVVRELIEKEGLSRREVARRYGVAPQAVAYCLRQLGVPPVEKSRYSDFIPWQVRVVHNNAPLVRRLRRHARIVMGQEVTLEQRAADDQWLTEIRQRNVVVDYHRDAGFFYTPRLRSVDGDSLIRQPT